MGHAQWNAGKAPVDNVQIRKWSDRPGIHEDSALSMVCLPRFLLAHNIFNSAGAWYFPGLVLVLVGSLKDDG
jgi:hypothetical protein